MSSSIPSEMRVLELVDYDEDLPTAVNNLRIATRPTPRPGPGEVLVRIAAAPCNPSDITFMQGLYGLRKALPAVPGWEGAGTVVASGGGIRANWLKGRRIACGGQADSDGTWAEYYLAPAKSCVPLRKSLSFEQGAGLIVNPLTAWALFGKAKRGRHRGIVQTAAASQLGRILVRLAADAGIPLINIVRRSEQADTLKALGAEVVLNSENDHFEEELCAACHNYKATIGFDAVTGGVTGTLLNAMPERSTVIVYGGLSYAPISGLDGRELIFGRKRLEGFWLTDWIRRAGFISIFRASNQIQTAIAKGILPKNIYRQMDLEEAPRGIEAYFHQMTQSKVLIVPRQD